jgi:hypothetical protein
MGLFIQVPGNRYVKKAVKLLKHNGGSFMFVAVHGPLPDPTILGVGSCDTVEHGGTLTVIERDHD